MLSFINVVKKSVFLNFIINNGVNKRGLSRKGIIVLISIS